MHHGEGIELLQGAGIAGDEDIGEQGSVFEIAKEPAHGVEGLGEVRAASPVAAADGGAIAGEAAEGGGAAHRAASIGTDGRERRAFKNAGRSAAGRSAGERTRIAGLLAVAEFGIFAGDAVGERVKVGLAGDDGPGFAELFNEPRVVLGDAVEIAIEVDAATGGCAGKVEAVFDGDGDTPEVAASIAKLAAGRWWHRCSARGFLQRPFGIAPDVGVLAGVPVGVLQRIPGKIHRLDASRGIALCERRESWWKQRSCKHFRRRSAESGIGL